MRRKDIQDNLTVADQPPRCKLGYADLPGQTVVDDGRAPRRRYRANQIGPRLQPSILDVGFVYHNGGIVIGSGRAVLNLPYQGFSFPIDRRGMTIGRSDRADLQIWDGTVSSMHARLSYESGVLAIEDMNSTNGTYLNGRKLEPGIPTRVREGSQIKFAKRLENTVKLNFRR